MSDNQNNGLIIALAGIGIVYFGIIRPITNATGLTKSAEDIAREEEDKRALQSLVDYILKTQKPTKTIAEWKSIADQIYNDLRYSSIDDNKADATYQVCRVQNDADLVILNQKFGTRQEYFFGVNAGNPKGLASFLTSNLSKTQIDTIRWNHANKGLKIKIV